MLDGFYAGSWNGIMRGSCPSDTGLWTRDEVEIEFNRRLMDNHGSVSKKNTAMHEIGHAYGLGPRLGRMPPDERRSNHYKHLRFADAYF